MSEELEKLEDLYNFGFIQEPEYLERKAAILASSPPSSVSSSSSSSSSSSFSNDPYSSSSSYSSSYSTSYSPNTESYSSSYSTPSSSYSYSLSETPSNYSSYSIPESSNYSSSSTSQYSAVSSSYSYDQPSSVGISTFPSQPVDDPYDTSIPPVLRCFDINEPLEWLEDRKQKLFAEGEGQILVNKSQNYNSMNTIRSKKGVNEGIHRWVIYIEEMSGPGVIFIGIVRRDCQTTTYLGAPNNGWALASNGNKIFCNLQTSFGPIFGKGDTVQLELDLTKGTLSFSVNSKPLSVAFTGFLAGGAPYFPAISLPGIPSVPIKSKSPQPKGSPVRQPTSRSGGLSSPELVITHSRVRGYLLHNL